MFMCMMGDSSKGLIMELEERQALFSVNVAKLLNFMSVKNRVTFGEAYRTPEQAALDVQKGTGILDSLHCKRLAVDLNLFDLKGIYLTDDSYHKPFGDYWKTLDHRNRWGGDFKRADGNHYEMQDLA